MHLYKSAKRWMERGGMLFYILMLTSDVEKLRRLVNLSHKKSPTRIKRMGLCCYFYV